MDIKAHELRPRHIVRIHGDKAIIVDREAQVGKSGETIIVVRYRNGNGPLGTARFNRDDIVTIIDI